MIKLEVEPYCQECPDFEPDVDKKEEILRHNDTLSFRFKETIIHKCDTKIMCKHRNKCRCIMVHLSEEQKKKTINKNEPGVNHHD